jgi:type II secretory pathway component PulF
MKFEYRALDAKGDEVQGVLEAETGEHAILYLLQKQLYPQEVKVCAKSTAVTYKKLDRLNNLKTKLEKHISKQKEKAVEPVQPDVLKQSQVTTSPSGWNVDWTYVFFVICSVGLVLLALKYGP